jgi:hypothetical protein
MRISRANSCCCRASFIEQVVTACLRSRTIQRDCPAIQQCARLVPIQHRKPRLRDSNILEV